MTAIEVLKMNLLSPLILSFILGVFARLVGSNLKLPKDLYSSLTIYLLLALGLKGGVALSETPLEMVVWPIVATLALSVITPISAYFLMRKMGRFGAADAAGLAAHYGSVSAVTFMVATQFVKRMGFSAEGFMPTLLTLLESPGIHIGIAIGLLQKTRGGKKKAAQERPQELSQELSGGLGYQSKVDHQSKVDQRAHVMDHQSKADQRVHVVDHQSKADQLGAVPERISTILREVLTSQSMILLMGGLFVGFLIGSKSFDSVRPFFETGFKGALVLFLLELGIVTADRIGDLRKVGVVLIALGVLVPILHGSLGVVLGLWSGLSVGGATILGAMAASASYIAAPPAVRMALPEANPTYYLTASLAITFPFNLVLGIPLFYRIALYFGGA